MSLIVAKTKLEKYLSGIEPFYSSLNKIQSYIDYRLSYIKKEAKAMLDKGASDTEIQKYLDKNQHSLKMLEEHIENESNLIKVLLEVLEDFELEVSRLNSKIAQAKYQSQERRDLTWSEREALRANQYAKWADYH